MYNGRKGRYQITDSALLEIFQECTDKVRSLGYYVPYYTKAEFDLKSKLGECSFGCIPMISIHKGILRNEKTLKGVIYHELCHLVAGPNEGHGATWKRIARKVGNATGYNIERCADAESVAVCRAECPVKIKEAKYIITCPKCGKTWQKYRQSNLTLNPQCFKHNTCGQQGLTVTINK